MSATATLIAGSISTTPSLFQTHSSLSSRTRATTFAAARSSFHSTPLSFTSSKPTSTTFHGFKRFSPVMQWQDSTVKMEIDVPVSVAYACYLDREAIPNWMPFISSVKILPDKPDLSRWSLKYKAFGRDIEYAWLARNMQEKISNLIL